MERAETLLHSVMPVARWVSIRACKQVGHAISRRLRDFHHEVLVKSRGHDAMLKLKPRYSTYLLAEASLESF